MLSTGRAKKWLRRATAAALVLALLLVVVVAAIHTAPVRAAVLRRAAGYLAARFNLLLQADSLRYNLLAGRISLSNVRLAAAHAAQDPFLTADTLEVTVPPALLFGTIAIDHVRLDNARFALHRRGDGSSNLPATEASANEGPPSPVYIQRLEIPRLAVSVTDESSGTAVSLPNLSIDVGQQDGQVRLIDTGRLSRRDDATTIEALDGGAAFDGRAIRLTGFNAVTNEATLTLDGEIALLVSEPGVDLRVSGTGDVGAVARWFTREAAPAGRVAIEATIVGPFSSPRIGARVRSDSIAYEGVTVANLEADVNADDSRLEASRVDLSLAGGRVNAAGIFVFASTEVRAAASWTDVGVAPLVRMLAPSASPVPAGRATGRGSFAGVPGDAAEWTIDVSNQIAGGAAGRGLLPIDGNASLGVNSGRWRFEGTHLVGGARVRTALAGAIDAENLARSTLTGTVEAAMADLSRVTAALAQAGMLEPATQTVVTGEIDAVASLSGSIARPGIQLQVSGEGLSAFDVDRISIDAKAAGDLRRSAVEARVRQGDANSVQINGTVWPDEARVDAHVEGTIGDIPALAQGIPIAGIAEIRFDARGPFDAISASGTMSVTDVRYADTPLGPLDAQFAVDAGVARIDATSPEFGARAHADLGLSGSHSAVVDLQVRDAQLARVIEAAGLDTGVSGTLSLTAHAEGSLDNWRSAVAAVDIDAFEGRMDDLPIRLRQPARVWYDGGTVDVVSLEAALGETQLSVAGRYPLGEGAAAIASSDALRGVLIGDLSHVVDALRAAGLAETIPVAGKGPVVVLTRVTGAGRQPLLSADVELGPAEIATMDLPPFQRVQVRARVADGAAEIVSASADWQQATIDLRARVPLALAQAYLPDGLFASTTGGDGLASLDLRATSITSEALRPFLPPDAIAEIQGQVDAVVHLEAPSLELDSLDGEARLDRADLTVAGVALAQQQPTRVVIENGIAQIASWNWTGRGTSLVVQGEVRLPDRRAAVLAGGQIDLRLLTPFLPSPDMAIGGTLTPRVSVSGPFDDLRIEGDVTMAQGEIRMRDPDVIVTGLSATALLERDRARISGIQGQINGGALTGDGEFTYGEPVGLGGSLHATIAGMGLEFPEGLRSELDGDLTLALMPEGDAVAGTLSGTVTVVRSAYREPIAVVGQLLSTLRTERLAAAVSGEPTFADRLRLNVRVLTDSDVVVDNNLARLQLGADLRLIGTAAAPALSGRATLREGGELYLGRNRYTVESGTIDFANPVAIEPDLNVQAQTRAGGEDIELTLKGTPETLSVDLRSTSAPELGQADIASLLLTGRTLNDVSGDEAEIVGEQVLAYLSGDVFGAASRVIGLDTIRLGGVDQTLRRGDSAEIASEADPTSRLTFGKSIGDSLEITLSQSLREGGAQTWILDYVPIPRVDLRFVSDDENLRSYQFRHDVTIGNPGGRRRAAARPEREVPRIAAVTLTGDLGGPEERLRRVLELEPGDEFDFSVWQDDRERLERALHDERRLEARVAARREDRPDGVALTYQIDAGPLTAIRFSGFSPSGETTRAIEAAWTRAIFDEALVDDVEDLVRRTLHDAGYLEPSVEATVASDQSTKTLDVVVQPGERARERRLAIDAGDDALARELERWADRANLEDLAWQDPAAFQRALVGELRRRGHLSPEVTVAPPRADGAIAVVRVDVRAGQVVTIGDVQVSGVSHVPVDRVRDAAGLEAGAPYDPAAIDSARERVARILRGEGFADARVEVKVGTAGGQATVMFVVDEGPQQVLREIAVTGNRAIDRDVIVRALDLSAGDPLGADAWLRARSRLFDTALFRRVDVTAEPIGEAAADQQPMRLLVTVEEWPALRVRYGLQLSEERPENDPEGRDLTPGLSADITRRTLFGRAITVGGALEYQRRERLVRGFLNTPTLLGMPVESILTAERSRVDFAEAQVISDRDGISWEQRVRLGRPLRLSYGYRYDRDHTFSTRPPDPLNPPFDETVNVARLTAAAVFDTRNNPLDTTRGWLVSSNFEYAAASLGSDIRFVRYLAQTYRFQPVGRVVLASAARLGLATALDGQSLLPSERFFAGGARSVRGVAEDSLGPRDIFGDVAGGGALVLFNQEVRVPLYRWFSGVGFIDVGNVFERPRTIDFGDLTAAFGAGLRVSTPFALLRADVARLWSPDIGQPIARWSFGIGQTF